MDGQNQEHTEPHVAPKSSTSLPVITGAGKKYLKACVTEHNVTVMK